MGASNSCLPVTRNNIEKLRRRSSLSHVKKTSNNEQIYSNPININHVSEDELLLLPGINRQLARSIIKYRNENHGFKQINELLNIDGVYLSLFERIKSDITIDSLPSQTSFSKKTKLININFASYDELCLINGLTPILARRIIRHRERKGLFRFIEDLLKIRGIDYVVLATIRPYITVTNPSMPISISHSSLNPAYSTLDRNNNHTNQNNSADTYSFALLLLETLPNELQTKFVSSPIRRPTTTSITKIKNENRFRFASWNLQNLTIEKAQNPGVRGVICQIIFENNFSLIGIQDIANKEALDYIIQELNNPTIPLVKDWSVRQNSKWNYIIKETNDSNIHESEYLGYIYDETKCIEIKENLLLPVKINSIESSFLTKFRLCNKYDFIFVNIHCKLSKINENYRENLSLFAQMMNDTIDRKPNVIFGNFNNSPTAQEFESLVKFNYSYAIQQNTDISLTLPEGSLCSDNIWVSEEAETLTTGRSGVIRNNLTNLWIPAGWTWGGLVSDHCPIWIEFDLS